MRKVQAALLLVFVSAALAAQKPQLPATPLGKRAEALLEAFNAGEVQPIRRFIEDNYATESLKQRPAQDRAATYLELYNETGGFHLRQVENASPESMTFLVETRATHEWYRITCQAQQQKPFRLLGAVFRLVARPSEFAPKGKRSDAEIVAEVQAYAEKLEKARLFGGVVLYASGDKPLLERAYPWRKQFGGTEAYQLDQRFGLASINKIFTATAVAQLADAGKLRFNDTIAGYLAEFPRERGEQITIHQLLTHTAGMEALLDPKVLETMFKVVKTRADEVRFLGGRPAVATPGQRFSYSNAGYLLLEAIVEKVAGEPFEQYAREHIFAPLGMTRTGGGDSTAGDMLHFSQGLQGGRLMTARMVETMMTPQVSTEDPDVRYGYGLRFEKVNGTRIVGHPGGGPTVSAQLDIYPDLGRTVVVLSRRPGGTAQRVANRLRELITQR